jgi:branched-chain amino acid transport system ATP-binding protein
MLDEPSLGLAPIMVERVFQLVRTLVEVKRLTILLVEQNVADALEISSRAYVLERGGIVRSGESRAMLDDPEIQRSYLGA